MTARSPSALFLSASLHGLVIAVILLLSYAMQASVKEVPKVFELVAGEGDNYGATAAPKLGTPGGIKIDIPEPPAPKPAAPTPPAPVAAVEPDPVPAPVKAPVEKAVPKTPAKTAEPKTPNFSNQIRRKIIRAESRAKAQIKKEREAEEKRLTKAEFDRQTKTAKAAANGNPKVKHIDADGISGGVMGGTTKEAGAGGKVLTREEGEVLDAYFAIVKQRLQDGLDKPPGLGDAVFAVAEFRLNADGSISSARLTRGSGSDEFDRAVLDDLRHYKRVSPPSAWKGDTISVTFRMKEEDSG